jgi:hypothetical protein
MKRSIVVAALLALSLPALPAAAGKPEHAGKQGGQGKGRAAPAPIDEKRDKGRHDPVGVVFDARHRELVSGYYADHYGRGHCPPGLAKKNNGCLPPGLAKKRYGIGMPLPAGVVIAPLPIELARGMGPAPYGYRYGVVDGDVVKLAVGTLVVVDAIDGLLD